ncbi:hypothetical protein EST38_g818 [Candolleomyces aberdarensis]|uniref:histone acetyltransferase n=1 Tax=Candolleomyces aberdarensis TaxID=2316362 RepID=A0A4Q2E095_9AGAR|nr:hypothetical protein EST38_g818 [Candolleomyces aberdarensis]
MCGCRHDVSAHNANETALGRGEWTRRSNVGIRIDEILQDSGRLFDFSYTDEDVKSLRKQMIPPGTSTTASSTASAQQTNSSPHTYSAPPTLSSSPGSSTSSLSDLESQHPPAKRRRATSSSSLSEGDYDNPRDQEEEDEEDDLFFKESVSSPTHPSATTRSTRTTGRKYRKGGSGGQAVASSSSSSSSDGEGDKPLASRLAASTSGTAPGRVTGKRTSKLPGHGHSGKKAKKGHHTVAGIAPAHVTHGENGERTKTNGINGGKKVNGTTKVKMEDKMDEGQLSRLAAGVAVDGTTKGTATGAKPPRTEKVSTVELQRGVIQIVPVSPPTKNPHGPPFTVDPSAPQTQDTSMTSESQETQVPNASSQTSMSISPSSSFVQNQSDNDASTSSQPSSTTAASTTAASHNDPSPTYDPRQLIILTGLKTLFQKQLPKMPREYIARLVYDENSRCLAIIKRGFRVVGGISFRPFPQRGFAEIVFFAINGPDQVKGYGGMLMDHFKAHIRKTYPSMHHFLTCADNYAVGYFEKQGFTKDITLDKSIWAGYIKDYEGSTIMQCTMVPKVDYLDKKKVFVVQQAAVLTKVRQMSKSHIVHQGLDVFKEGRWEEGMAVDPRDVPGLRETGWNPEMEKNMQGLNLKSPDYQLMERTLHTLRENSAAWPFQDPVNLEEVPDYLDVIKQPMDFKTMGKKLKANKYKNIEQFVDDAMLIFSNCRLYNPETTKYAKLAHKMEKVLEDLLPSYARRD